MHWSPKGYPSGCQTTADDHAIFLETLLIVIAGLLLFLLTLCQYFRKTATNWNGLIDIYILCTLGIPASRPLSTWEGGFNQLMGYGILVHNVAELLLLGHLWFGSPQNKKVLCLWIITYVWAVSVIITFVPIPVQVFLLTTQCLFCDWTLLATFVFLGGAKHRREMSCSRHLGTCAAMMQLVTSETLLFGIATTYRPLEAISVACLLPPFILYTWISEIDHRSHHSTISPDSPYNTVQELRIEMAHSDGISIELKQRRAACKVMSADHNAESVASDEHGEMRQMTHDDVIRIGLLNVDSKNRKPIKSIAFACFSVSFLNAIIIFLSPCFVGVQHASICD